MGRESTMIDGSMPDPPPKPPSDPATPPKGSGASSPKWVTTASKPGFGEAPPPSAAKEQFTRTIAATSGFDAGTASAPKDGYLTMIAGPHVGALVKLGKGESTLGRAPESSLRVDGEGVSWQHARIFRVAGEFIIEDLKSTNGTGVNDKRISTHQLLEGDRIHLGPGVILRFNRYDELEAGVQRELYESAVRDPLTRAFNRKHFQERLHGELAFAARHHTALSLVLFDIDFFKKVNDTYGHPGGDAVLRAISAGVLSIVRSEDVFARVGGEEFAILLRGDAAGALAFAERIRLGIQGLRIPWNDTFIPVTSSFGVSSLDELPAPDGDRMIAIADERLYRAKGGGRNRVVGA